MSVKVINSSFSYLKILSSLLLLFSGYVQADCDCEEDNKPFLTNQQSPLLIGAGNIGAAVPMRDAMGFYYNPAQLGYFSRDNYLSYFFMPQETKKFDYYDDPNVNSFNTSGFTAGYNFQKVDSSLPLSVGVGYILSKITYRRNTFEENNGVYSRIDYKDYEYFNSFSAGVSYSYYLLFNLGFAFKTYGTINGYDYSSRKPAEQKRTGTAFDFGALINAPISDLLLNKKLSGKEGTVFKPKFEITLGYSVTNSGKKFDFYESGSSDPIQRTARLGYTIDLGVEAVTADKKFNVIDYSFTAEVEDLLIKYDEKTHRMEYQDLSGNIRVVKNLIGLKPDLYVAIHKGHIFRLAETVIIAIGRENYNSVYSTESNCYGFSSEGLFKLIESEANSALISYLANHIKVEYYYAKNKTGFNSVYKGLAIYFKEIEL